MLPQGGGGAPPTQIIAQGRGGGACTNLISGRDYSKLKVIVLVLSSIKYSTELLLRVYFC